MIKPDFQSYEEALEFAAQLVEQMSIREIAGMWSKRKRDREDAALRGKTIRETKAEMAQLIRAFKDRPDLSPITKLREMANLDGAGDFDHALHLRDAWPLAAKGWVRVLVTVDCVGNSIPPQTRYRIEITDKGRNVLAADSAKEGPNEVEEQGIGVIADDTPPHMKGIGE